MDYFKNATQTSPVVMIDSQTKSALISGICTCNDVSAYDQVLEEMRKHIGKFNFVDLNIKLKFFNMRAAKALLDLLKSLKEGLGKHQAIVHWYHEKDDLEMKEMASDYSELLEMEFNVSDN